MNQTLSNWTTGSNYSDFIFFSFLTNYIVLLSGAVLNIIVVSVMVRSGKIRQNISSFLVFHLSVTHLCYFTETLLFYLSGTFYAGNSSTCKASVLIDFACAAAIFSSLVAIAWDRHRNVLRPFKSLAPKHLKTYLLLIAAIWTYAFLTSVPFIYSVKTDSEVICRKENNGTVTDPCREYSWCYFPSHWTTQLSKTIYFLLAFFIPLMYMFITYTKIAVSLWERNKNGTIHGAVSKYKGKSTRLMVVAVLGFVVCWGPTFWIDLLSVCGVFQNSFILQIWCSIGKTLSSCVNPIIYAFLSPEFRKHFLKFCCCCCSCTVCCSHRRQSHKNRVQPVMFTAQAAV